MEPAIYSRDRERPGRESPEGEPACTSPDADEERSHNKIRDTPQESMKQEENTEDQKTDTKNIF